VPDRRDRAPLPEGRITKADIERKLRQLSGELEEGAQQGRRIGPWVVGVAATFVVIYRLGLALGARKSPQLEIRRVLPPG
jgi:hypothetical protein